MAGAIHVSTRDEQVSKGSMDTQQNILLAQKTGILKHAITWMNFEEDTG